MPNLKEVVLISGKGGTGKTSLVASAIPYINQLIIADCDVDAPDLNLLFGEKIKSSLPFIGAKKAVIEASLCSECGDCIDNCKFDAISEDFRIDAFQCEGCGVCEWVCLNDAIQMQDKVAGHILISDTPYGEMVHGKLIPGEENSGKLVAQVRQIAKQRAQKQGLSHIIIDGSPGIGCSVIASITGVHRVVIVIEPTLSGLHDLKRVYQLSSQFHTQISVIINKWDLCVSMSEHIQAYCENKKIEIDAKIPFNPIMVEAISHKKIPSVYAPEFFKQLHFKQIIEHWFE